MSVAFVVASREASLLETAFSSKKIPSFMVGDTLSAKVRVVEGVNERVAVVSGVCVRHVKRGVLSYIVLRRICSGGIGVERRIPLCSPLLISIEVSKKGLVRRAVLSYLRNIRGALKIRERFNFTKRKGITSSSSTVVSSGS